eukprot:gene10380-10538_t
MRVRVRIEHGLQPTCWHSQLCRKGFKAPSVCLNASKRRTDAPLIDAEFEVPQVGWMWDSGKAAATKTSLKAANIKAKKSLGQNFCTDDRVLSDIVNAARVTPADGVIEVGPGTGNLTRHLLATKAQVLAVEKDDTLVERLRQEFHEVVANLPYNITKDFLLALLPQGALVSELNIMIQEEVAQRLVDPTPGRPDYRAMSVITHYYSKPVYRFRIPKEKYFPVPGVDGALVTFKLLPPSKRVSVPGERGFVVLVNKAFSERRKMLRNTLQPLYTAKQVEAALSEASIRPDARAQDLSVEQFAAVYNHLHQQVLAAAGIGGDNADGSLLSS